MTERSGYFVEVKQTVDLWPHPAVLTRNTQLNPRYELNEMSKQKGIAAALEATRAVQEVVNSTVAESKEKLASEEGMSQRNIRKVLASIERI